MEAPDSRNAGQIASWNGEVGRHWTEQQASIDLFLAPVFDALFGAMKLEPGMRVLDIGCGCGTTTFDIARRVAPGGRAVGIDISAPMLAKARETTPPGLPVEFIEADATTHPFEPGGADLLFSRFGVMFFADPALAFANMRNGLRKGGRVLFAAWRDVASNAWQSVSLAEVRKLAPPPAQPIDPDAPGPNAFAREERVRAIMSEAGFTDIVLRPVDLMLDTATGRGLEAAVRGAFEMGPTSRMLDGQSDEVRTAARVAIRAALASYQRGETVPMGAAVWIVTAANP